MNVAPCIQSLFASVLVNFFLNGLLCLEPSTRTVQTKYGLLRGQVVAFTHTQPVEQFLGIPYASPPVGELRFMPPVTASMWEGVRDADNFGPVCPQNFPDISNKTDALLHMPLGRYLYLSRLKIFLENESEDCLYLNIYVPEIARMIQKKIPVMVFLHGESHDWNSGNSYNGSVLASVGNVIVVTINYRLGVLGFLTTNDESSRGNYGIFDQVAALHWIEQNIGNIGGDVSNITIFGHGSGAAFVHMLMLSPVAKGLFQRAIMQSGAASSTSSMTLNPKEQTIILAKNIGCFSNINKVMVRCLKKRDYKDLLEAAKRFRLPGVKFGPTVDGVAIPSRLENLMKNNVYHFGKHDLLVGVTRAEYYIHFGAEDVQLGIDEKKRYKIIHNYIHDTLQVNTAAITAVAVNEYTDWTTPVQNPINLLDAAADLLGDAHRVAPVVKAAKHHAKMKQRTFMYVFGYQTRSGDYSDRLGCIHGEDLPYLFGAPLISEPLSYFQSNFTSSERSLSDLVIHYWTNFAYTGDPNRSNMVKDPVRASEVRKFLWPKYESTQQRYITIGMRPKIRNHYRAHKLSLWLELIPQLSRIVSFQLGKEMSGLDRIVTDGPVKFDELSTGSMFYTSTEPLGGASTTPLVMDVGATIDLKERWTRRPNVTRSASADDSNNSTYLQILHTTIAVGTALLIINVVIFTATLYQKKGRKKYNTIEQGGSMSLKDSGGAGLKKFNEYTVDQVSPGSKHAYLKKPNLISATDHRCNDEDIQSVEKTLHNGGILSLDRSLKRGRGDCAGQNEAHKMCSIRPLSSNSSNRDVKKMDNKRLQEINV